MPWHDWQFWLATLMAGTCALHVLRQLLPRRGAHSPACGGCASGAAACAKASQAEPEASKLVTLGR